LFLIYGNEKAKYHIPTQDGEESFKEKDQRKETSSKSNQTTTQNGQAKYTNQDLKHQ